MIDGASGMTPLEQILSCEYTLVRPGPSSPKKGRCQEGRGRSASTSDEGINSLYKREFVTAFYFHTFVRRKAHVTNNSGRHAHIIQAGELHVVGWAAPLATETSCSLPLLLALSLFVIILCRLWQRSCSTSNQPGSP